MMIQDRIEDGFSRFADTIQRHRGMVIGGSLLLTALLSLGLPQLRIETSFSSYLPESNSRQQVYQEFRRQFGAGERVVVLLRPAEVFDLDFLEELRRLHEELEENLPHVREVTSLINARQLTGTEDSLISEGLLDDWPETDADLQDARRRVRSNPLYRNTIISEDESATAIVIELEAAPDDSAGDGASRDAEDDLADALLGFEGDSPSDPPVLPTGNLLTTSQASELVRALDVVLAEASPKSTEVHVAGTPILAHRLGEMLTRDITIFVGLSLLFTAALLYLLFRSIRGMIFPLVVVIFSITGTLGWMGLAGIPMTAATEILPSLLVAIGVGDAVHIQAMFFSRLRAGDSTEESIRWAMNHSGLAVVLTSLTTAASMAAFRVADLQPIIDLGRTAPIGVGLALLFSVTLLPALLSLAPARHARHRSSAPETRDRLDRALLRLGSAGMRHPRIVLAATVLLWSVSIFGAKSLYFSQDDLSWLPEHEPIRVAVEQLNATMKGGEPLEFLIELEADDDLRDPAFLIALDELQHRAQALTVGEVSVGQTLSVVDVVKETHRALSTGAENGLVIPASRELVSQELLLFESADPEDLEQLIDSDYRIARVMLTVPFVDALHYPRFAREIERIAGEVLAEKAPLHSAQFTSTGLVMLAGETFELLFASMARSYTVAFGVITVLMFFLIRNVRMSFLSMLPNITPVLLVLGLMGWMDSPLDVSSMLVGGILIGVVVDDTIHFIHNFVRYRRQMGCSLQAIRQTLTTTGRAMLVTSTVLSIGFFVFTGAWLENVSDFGLLCGLGAIFAFFADIVLLPALVALAVPCAQDCSCTEH
jgi:predicted RND superfamily exporter protein